MEEGGEEEKQLMEKIAKILDEARTSQAIHNRKLKELSALRLKCPSSSQFFSAFSKTLTPLFNFQRRASSAERVVRVVSIFASTRDPNNYAYSDEFLDNFLKFLVVAAAAANKTARFRACQIISEVIMRLPDDAEVSDDLLDELIECMKQRVGDKVSSIRTFAVRALSRFVNDSENSDILDLFLEVLPLEQNAEVRKALVLSLPPLNTTSQLIIDCTLDVNESVRKAAYCVIANKFPLQSLSIKLRTVILQRGLADRSPSVSKECFKLMKDEWLIKCCNGDPIELLKYLDVETYELVGTSVMETLLNSRLVKLNDGASVRQYIAATNDRNEENMEHCSQNFHLMEPEVALYWRTVCKNLQLEAQAKGSDAAATMGAEAAVYAAEAADKNDLLERILPATVSDYIELVKAHTDGGINYRFASRQLLLLGGMLDFSDATNRKVASVFLQEMMLRPLEHEVDNDGNMVIIGDGINLGGDRDWADSLARLAKQVHAAPGEFEEAVLKIIEVLAQPCRERTADFVQWMHSLALTGLLLENAKSFHSLQGKAIEPDELLKSLLLPGARHAHLDVQRVAIRCLGLYGLLERKNPSEELVKQLRRSYIKGPHLISLGACKALIDLVMWHGPQNVDSVLGQGFTCHDQRNKEEFVPVDFVDSEGNWDVGILDLLYGGFEKDDWGYPLAGEEDESVHAILGEGFAKILLLSGNYPSLPPKLHPMILTKLIILYFSNVSEHLQRLKQCLSVFFDHYPSLSANHKKCISKAFISVMRLMWPGIDHSAVGSPVLVSNMRKNAVQASRFILQMMQAPLYTKETEPEAENCNDDDPEVIDGSEELPFEFGEEGLAIRIAVEVARFQTKKTSAEKAYVSALCRILVLLHFRLSEQGAIKLMRRLLNIVAESVLYEKDLVKELRRMAEHLKAVDRQADEELPQEHANLILEKLELDFNLDVDGPVAIPETPVQRSTKPARSRRRVRIEEASSDEDDSPTSVPVANGTVNSRSQRASKAAAMTKMSASKALAIYEDDDQEEGDSELTSHEDSDGSCEYS